MVGSDTLRALIPEVINTGFSALYENVGVPKNAIDKKEKTLKEFYDEINTTNTKISNDPSKRAEYVAELSKSLDRIAGKNDYDFTALTSGRTEEAAKNVLDALFNEFAAKLHIMMILLQALTFHSPIQPKIFTTILQQCRTASVKHKRI